MIAGGVPAGATRPNDAVASKPGKPDSASVGEIGRRRHALERGHGERAQLAVLHLRQHRGDVAEEHGDAAADQSGVDGRCPAIRHVTDVNVSHRLEQFAGEMLRGPDAGGAVCQLTRLRPRERNELRHALRRHVVVEGEDVGREHRLRDRDDVLYGVERHLIVEARIDRELRQ
jgi:hypothetical protein